MYRTNKSLLTTGEDRCARSMNGPGRAVISRTSVYLLHDASRRIRMNDYRIPELPVFVADLLRHESCGSSTRRTCAVLV